MEEYQKFIQFDLKEFSTAISESILGKAINFKKEFIDIESSNLRTIRHCKNSLLFGMNEAWKVKVLIVVSTLPWNYDVAKICELLAIFILISLGNKIDQQDIELDRDDGLITLRNVIGQKPDRTRKYIMKVIKDPGFQIEIETNLKEINLLDVTFCNSNSGLYQNKPKRSQFFRYKI